MASVIATVFEAFLLFVVGGILILFFAQINTSILASGAQGNANLTGLSRVMAGFLLPILILIIFALGVVLLVKAYNNANTST